MQPKNSAEDDDRAAVFTQRLNSLIGSEPVAAWAERHGLNPQSIYNLKGKMPGLNLLLQIQRGTGCSVDWLLGLTEARSSIAQKPLDQVEGDWSEFVRIPLYEAKASAGHGATIADGDDVKGHIPFRRSFLRDMLRLPPNGLYCVEVRGSSMEPILRNGAPALIQPTNGEVVYEGPYLLRMEGALLLKNLQRLPGGRLRIWSENQTTSAFQPIEVDWPPREGVDLQVFGRVRWSDNIF
jgi:phage repressor protein C with HTH and peptisase S24 domain